jgi:hypothetical protein
MNGKTLTELQQRARKLLCAWKHGDPIYLQSVIDESQPPANSSHAQELAEAIQAVVELMRNWLCLPEQVPTAELEAALGLLRHLAKVV